MRSGNVCFGRVVGLYQPLDHTKQKALSGCFFNLRPRGAEALAFFTPVHQDFPILIPFSCS
jgi:hypothetical protein